MIKPLIIFLFISMAISNSFAQNFDIDLLREINLERNTNLDKTMVNISKSVTPIVLGAPIVAFATGALWNQPTTKKKGIYLAQSLLVATVFSASLKYSIRKDRPYVTYPDIERLFHSDSPTFPSGHTTKAFSTATSLSIAFPKWYIIAPSFIWAGAVGYSRMHLGVHYPSDVLAGAILGSGSAFLTYKANQWINKKYDKKLFFDGNKTLKQ